MTKSLYDKCICLVDIWNIQHCRLLDCFRLFHSSMNLSSIWTENFDAHTSLFCTHTHRYRYKVGFKTYRSLTAELLKREIWLSGQESAPLPFCAEEDPSASLEWKLCCHGSILVSTQDTLLSAFHLISSFALSVSFFSLLSWNSICLPSWLEDIFLPFPSSNQSKSEKNVLFAVVSHFSMTAFVKIWQDTRQFLKGYWQRELKFPWLLLVLAFPEDL